ncbi:methyl-CpG-binding domain protein 1-like [Monodelphis domestica]|uniref:methyl-CpG-binding domain protein 1-like n=1 Tax=Monodelphis domestica TaxID=13616 RepID=UPI0000F2DCB8|nr:methyl-CpG-binding domain protein 1-like [Monodelphis domestica]
MADHWLDCPTLGPGWKRREVPRKSGTTCGRTDTYYQSPTGDRIRSKVELTRFMGPDCDLSSFDFKSGVLRYLPTKASSQKKKRPARLEKRPLESLGAPIAEASKLPPAPWNSLSKWCEKCGARISGDSAGRQRLRFLCKCCRAQRNDFNREQRMFKRVGCGDCKACQVTEDCGVCPACVAQLSQPGGPQLPQSRCVQRRCLKIVNKSFGCGLCSGCQTKEDCGACRICERRGRPGLKRRWKCLQRRCLRSTRKKPRGLAARKHPGRRRRGTGPPLLPPSHSPAEAVGPSGAAQEYERPGLGAPVKQEVEEGYVAQTPGVASPPPGGASPVFPSKGANQAQLQHSLKHEGEAEAAASTPVIMEIYSLSGAIPTVAAGPCGGLDGVLQEFLMELNELPLPAHWEVLPPRGPELCITQRSPLSTVAAAVIHIQAGLYFHVVVQDINVPPTHELYSAHPLRLTTVDEVIELICHLEAYCLCPGWPGSWGRGSRSPDCEVLVYEGSCQACSLGERQ